MANYRSFKCKADGSLFRVNERHLLFTQIQADGDIFVQFANGSSEIMKQEILEEPPTIGDPHTEVVYIRTDGSPLRRKVKR